MLLMATLNYVAVCISKIGCRIAVANYFNLSMIPFPVMSCVFNYFRQFFKSVTALGCNVVLQLIQQLPGVLAARALVFGVVNPYLLEIVMEHQIPPAANRMHPLMLGAAASVVLVSLLGAAAITGILPASHSTPAPSEFQVTSPQTTAAATQTQTVTPVSGSRFLTADGRILEEVPTTVRSLPAHTASIESSATSDIVTPVHHRAARHPVHHRQQLALNDRAADRTANRAAPYRTSAQQQVAYEAPVNQVAQAQTTYPVQASPQPIYQPQTAPTSVFGNVNPVQTGVGAVIGGLLGSQVGKGNGRTLATVAGVIAGGYAGNEISHGRSPVPTW